VRTDRPRAAPRGARRRRFSRPFGRLSTRRPEEPTGLKPSEARRLSGAGIAGDPRRPEIRKAINRAEY